MLATGSQGSGPHPDSKPQSSSVCTGLFSGVSHKTLHEQTALLLKEQLETHWTISSQALWSKGPAQTVLESVASWRKQLLHLQVGPLDMCWASPSGCECQEMGSKDFLGLCDSACLLPQTDWPWYNTPNKGTLFKGCREGRCQRGGGPF